MGYNIRAGMVEENKGLLLVILSAFNRGRELRLRPEAEGDTVYQLQMRIRRLLKATEVLNDECDGMFSDLGKMVTLKIDSETKQLIVRARKVITGRMVTNAPDPDEEAMLAQLGVSKGTMELLDFIPTDLFNEDDFAQRVAELGWTLLLETKSANGERLMYAAERERVEEAGSPLARYGK